MSTTLDCELLRDLWGSADVRAVFDSRALAQAWLDVERALAQAEAEVGVVPEAAAERIAREADADLYDLDVLREGLAESQHPLVPLVRALAERCGEHGGWVHWGVTTQDVIDTALVLQSRAALEPIRHDLARSRAAAARLAAAPPRHADGRSDARAARGADHLRAQGRVWADELGRAVAHGSTGRPRASCVGAARWRPRGRSRRSAPTPKPPFRRRSPDRSSSRSRRCRGTSPRDRLRDLAHALDEIAAAAERIALEIVRLQSTEIAEVGEPLAPGHVGSSTMPQKRNPMSLRVRRRVGQSAPRARRRRCTALGRPCARARHGAWAAEWLALPQAFILAGGIVEKLASILEGLTVSSQRMGENLALTRGQIMAEAVMMAIAGRIGRERAHELVSEASTRATAEGRGLGDVLRLDREVTDLLAPEEISRLLEPESYLGIAAQAVDAAVRENSAS